MTRTAAALVIGNEVLSGKIQDTNSYDLARFLRPLGVDLRRITTVADDPLVIIEMVNALRAQFDLVFTSGGIGPTHDDVTIESIALALDRRTMRHPTLEASLRAHFLDRCTDEHLRMASVIEGTTLHHGDHSAPWPAMQVANIFILPGIPQLFRAQLDLVRPALASADRAFVVATVLCRGDEPSLKPRIDAVVERFSDVSVGSYPRWLDRDDDQGAYSVKVTFDGVDCARVNAAAACFAATIESTMLVALEPAR